MRLVTEELMSYFNSLDELYDTAEMVAGNEDYLVIHVDRKAFDEVRYFKERYYAVKAENQKAIWGE
jgi:hypothetical protein